MRTDARYVKTLVLDQEMLVVFYLVKSLYFYPPLRIKPAQVTTGSS